MTNTEQNVRQIIANVTGLQSDLPGDANLYLDLGIASVYALQLLSELERQFEISVPDEDFVDAMSINDLAAMIDRIRASSQSGEYATT